MFFANLAFLLWVPSVNFFLKICSRSQKVSSAFSAGQCSDARSRPEGAIKKSDA